MSWPRPLCALIGHGELRHVGALSFRVVGRGEWNGSVFVCLRCCAVWATGALAQSR